MTSQDYDGPWLLEARVQSVKTVLKDRNEAFEDHVRREE
jgi:hypothetical protein